MLQTSITPTAATPLPSDRTRDYHLIRRAIAFLSEKWAEQPSLERLAQHLELSPAHCQKLFKRWCGLSPKEFVQAITVDHARGLLEGSASVFDAALEVGLSGGSRLHDLFVSHEAMTPGDYKAAGAGLVMRYGFHPSPFGEAVLIATDRGLAGLGFVDDGDRQAALADLTRRWPKATYLEDEAATAPLAKRVFNPSQWQAEQPLRVVLIGTDFEVRVWQTLLRIPRDRATTYSDIARHIGKPAACRAVGAAVGKNPVSFVVPCHRVLGRSGALTGYHWGLTRKQAILGWEAGRKAA